MTAMRTFRPTDEYRPFRVLLGVDDGERITITIPHALGQHDAAHLATEQARKDGHFDVMALKVEPAE